MTKKNIYPAVPRQKGQGRDVLALAEGLEILTGQRGDKLDKALTLRDLNNPTLTAIINGDYNFGVIGGGTSGGGSGGSETVEAPTQPENVSASGAQVSVLIRWDYPSYGGHAYAEIWRSAEDNFGTAVLVGTNTASVHADPAGVGAKFYYWVRFVNANGVTGPLHATGGVYAETMPDIEGIILETSEGLEASALSLWLRSEVQRPSLEIEQVSLAALENALAIDTHTNEARTENASVRQSITAVETDQLVAAEAITELQANFATEQASVAAQLTSINQTITTNEQATALSLLGLQSNIDTLDAETEASILAVNQTIATNEQATAASLLNLQVQYDGLQGEFDGLALSSIAGYSNLIQAIADGDSAVSQEVTTLEASIAGSYATLQSLSSVEATLSGQYTAQWGVKTNVNNLQGGVGFYNNGSTTKFLVTAATFAVLGPGSTSVAPLIVDGGVVYLNHAMIKQAAIVDAQIGSLTVDKLIGNTGEWVVANIGSASIGFAKIQDNIQSNNYAAGSTGWRIYKNGYAEFRDIKARGDIEATSLKANTLMVNEGHIANLSVSALKIQDNAVTIPVSSYTQAETGYIWETGGWTAVQSLTIDPQGAKVYVSFGATIFMTADVKAYCQARVMRGTDPTPLYETQITLGDQDVGNINGSFTVNGFSGSSQLRLEVAAAFHPVYDDGSAPGIKARQRSLVAIGLRK